MIKKEYITLKIKDIVPYKNNNKIHTEKDISEIVKSIKKNSDLSPILVDEENIILAGHGRLEAFKKLKYKEVKLLKIIGLKEEQKKDFRLRDNTTNLLSEWDFDNINLELEDLGDFSSDLLDNFNLDKLEENIEDSFKMDTSINDFLEEGGFREQILKEADEFGMTFVFDKKYKEKFQEYFKTHGKNEIVDFIINKIENA